MQKIKKIINTINDYNDITFNLKRLLNVREASHYLGISETAVYKYVEWGMISFRRFPSIPTSKKLSKRAQGRIVFEIEDLDNFIEKLIVKKEGNAKIPIQEKSLDNFN